MQARYVDKKEITPQDRTLITETLCMCFDDISSLKGIAREKLHDAIYDNINWDDAKKWVYNNLVSECARKGEIGLLLEEAQKLQPSIWLEKLTWRLLRPGYLAETSPIPKAPANAGA